MITGTIKAIYPDGEFDTSYGHFYAFKMTIEDANGNQTTGGINSKSSNYPLGHNDPICVETKNTPEHGLKFKKVNPEYAQNNQQQANTNNRQNGNGNGRNTSIERQCAWKGACNRAQGMAMSNSDIEDLAMMGIHLIETGNRKSVPQQAAQGQDDIPF